ncbi:unnamed protein product [Mycena citricolor]|uniref:Uncharacterized protein n=1 Tax=Mycena citricolor TaxID=2018698 RepID=A0AAD2H5D3_9AGAR|nr:unnamed protein product [Mycena citricolor]
MGVLRSNPGLSGPYIGAQFLAFFCPPTLLMSLTRIPFPPPGLGPEPPRSPRRLRASFSLAVIPEIPVTEEAEYDNCAVLSPRSPLSTVSERGEDEDVPDSPQSVKFVFIIPGYVGGIHHVLSFASGTLNGRVDSIELFCESLTKRVNGLKQQLDEMRIDVVGLEGTIQGIEKSRAGSPPH